MYRLEKNVLLAVDDETDFLDLIVQVGEGVGYDVCTASTPAAFREHLARKPPSLVLLDLQMPGMDGVEALRYLAYQGVRAGVLLASGMDQRVLSSARQLGDSLGLKMLGTLQKPALLEEIEDVLRKYVERDSGITTLELTHAIDHGELKVFYQPKIAYNGSDWRFHAAEALVRWQHPKHGLLLPADFLDVAEKSGLITRVTDYVLTEAIRQAGSWRQRGLEIGVGVNLSPRLVQDLELPDRLTRTLKQFSVDPHQLTLEVTEAASADDPELVMDIFTRLRVKGIGLSLDDFGVGVSSLTYLYRMPFSEVKIDDTLLGDVPNGRGAATLVRALVDLAHAFSLSVCAEGVRDLAAFEFLDKLGCDALQGDCISPPLPAAEIEVFANQWSRGDRAIVTPWREDNERSTLVSRSP